MFGLLLCSYFDVARVRESINDVDLMTATLLIMSNGNSAIVLLTLVSGGLRKVIDYKTFKMLMKTNKSTTCDENQKFLLSLWFEINKEMRES